MILSCNRNVFLPPIASWKNGVMLHLVLIVIKKLWRGEGFEEGGKRRTLTNSSSMKALQERLFFPKTWILGERSTKFSGGTWNLTSLEKRVCRAYRVRFGKNSSKAPTPWSPSHLPWLFKQHHSIKGFRAKAGKGGVISNRILQKKGFGLNGAGKGRLFSCKTSFLVWLLN